MVPAQAEESSGEAQTPERKRTENVVIQLTLGCGHGCSCGCARTLRTQVERTAHRQDVRRLRLYSQNLGLTTGNFAMDGLLV